MKPYGLCDICKKHPAQIWVGRTSAASCKDSKCAEENKLKLQLEN